MKEEELNEKLTNLGLADDRFDKQATVFYIVQLEEVFTYFKTDLNKPTDQGGFGDNYKKVKAALEKKNLLLLLVDILYEKVAEAIVADLIAKNKISEVENLSEIENRRKTIENFKAFKETRSYGIYYENSIFDDDGSKVNDFYTRFPRAQHARDKLTAHFKNNIKQACERVIKDWEDIETVFFTSFRPKGIKISSLDEIETSGSDFHKGGKQVLFLTFTIKNDPSLIQNLTDQFKLVYKPSDLEADCRLIGDSTALALADAKFFKPVDNEDVVGSLMEIINGWIQGTVDSKLKVVPTYKLLPRNYGSSLNDVSQINTSYGYIEYLHQEETEHKSVFREFSQDRSDYIVDFEEQGADDAVKEFYTIMGQLIAISMTFSISDLHSENLIVHNLKPYIIDLEASLVKHYKRVEEVGFFIRGRPDNASITGTQGGRNRLYSSMSVEPIDPKDYIDQLIEGFEDMMDLLKAKVTDTTMALWFKRLNNAVVRQVPIPTTMFGAAMRSIYNFNKVNRNTAAAFEVDLNDHFKKLERRVYDNAWEKPILKIIELKFTREEFKEKSEIEKRKFWSLEPFPDPIFFVLNKSYLSKNFKDLDVPVYYQRLGTQNMYDYTGTEIPIENVDYVTKAQKTKFLTFHKVQKYYAYADQQSPTTKNVQGLQFDKLGDDAAFNVKKQALVKEIRDNLNE